MCSLQLYCDRADIKLTNKKQQDTGQKTYRINIAFNEQATVRLYFFLPRINFKTLSAKKTGS